MGLPQNPSHDKSKAQLRLKSQFFTIDEITRQIGVNLQRIVADKGYRGHNAPKGQGLAVFSSGQKRRIKDKIKSELRRRSAVEPVIGHLKADHRTDRNFLKGQSGDAMNALLAAVGYNFKLLLNWITLLWAFFKSKSQQIKNSKQPEIKVLHDRLFPCAQLSRSFDEQAHFDCVVHPHGEKH